MFGIGPLSATRVAMPDVSQLTQNPMFPIKQRGFFGKAIDRAGGPTAILQALSAGAHDLSQGTHTLPSVLQQLDEEKRRTKMQDELQASLALLQANPNATKADWMKAFAPILIQQGNIGAAVGLAPDDPRPPTRIQTPDGVLEIPNDGTQPHLIYKNEPKAPTASPGWDVLPDGTWTPRKGGPYDPEYIAKTSGVRREAVVSRPMPQRARTSGGRGGGGGVGGMPAGYGFK